MPSLPANIISLAAVREALAARFPEAAPLPERFWATGWPEIDAPHGGLRQNAVTELCSTPGCGGFFLDQVLTAVRGRRSLAALVDGARSFDPGSYAAATFPRLLVAFGETAEQGIKITDLLLRDGNLPLVLLNLQATSLRGLGRIPASTWHRFQRLVERSGTALVVMTPQPIVEAARVRITLRQRWSLAALKSRRRDLLPTIEVQTFHRGKQGSPLVERDVRIG